MPPTDTPEIKYDAFISYARADGRELADRLWQTLSARGLKPWRDERDLKPYLDFSVGIERAIRASRVVVVLLTPEIVNRDDSFVRRETIYALAQGKPILALVCPGFDERMTPVHLAHLTRIPHTNDKEFDALAVRIREIAPEAADLIPTDDPFRQHVEDLLAFVLRRLEETIFNAPEIIALTTRDDPDKVRANPATQPHQFATAYRSHRWKIRDVAEDESLHEPPALRTYENFADAFAAHEGRVLLLGEPGAGKTTTLLAFARDKCYERLAHPASPLPVYVSLGGWNGEKSFFDWMADETKLDVDALRKEIDAERALLLLDGLDEARIVFPDPIEEKEDTQAETAGFEKKEQEPRDLRIGIMTEIAGAIASTLVTCRVKDYEDTVQRAGVKIALNAGIRIEQLTDGQISDYLRNQPELITALKADTGLMDMARTPLLLTLLAIGYAGATEKERWELRNLKASSSELRARIFNLYFDKRYEFETAKGVKLPAKEKCAEVLGALAFNNQRVLYAPSGVVKQRDLQAVGGNETFDEVLTRLHLLRPTDDGSLRFIHLLLRDHFAFYGALAALRDQDAYVRRSAVYALGQSGDPRAIDPLIVALRDQDAYVRRSAAYVLSQTGDPRAIDPLIAVLSDQDAYVRRSAAYALGQTSAPRAIDPLIAALRDQDTYVRSSAIEAFRRIGARAVGPLITALHDDDEIVRRNAIYALGQTGDPRAVDPLIAVLRDDDMNVRSSAAEGLGKIGDPYAVAPLIATLRDDSDEVRSSAIEALGKIGAQAADPLISALRDDSDEVRSSAIEALGKIGAQAADPLISALRDNEKDVRSSAIEALARIGGPAVASLIAALRFDKDEVRSCIIEALSRIGAPAINLLIIALRDEDTNFLAGVAKALSRIGDSRAISHRVAALHGSNTENCRKAADVLIEIGIPVIDILITDLSDERADVRNSAASSLGSIGATRAVEPLTTLLHEDDDEMRIRAIIALGKIGDPLAVSSLINALSIRGRDWRVPTRAAEALGCIADPRAVEPLAHALRAQSAFIRISAAEALGHIADARATSDLVKSLQDEVWSVRRNAAQALGRIADTRAIEPLIDALNDEDELVRNNVIHALRQIGTPKAEGALRTYLDKRESK